MRTKYLLGCATIVAGGLLGSGFASAQSLGPLVKAAGGSVFNHCTADKVASQPGFNYAGSLIEPWIAADPTTAGHLLAASQQDRWSDGGARGLRGEVSTNAGRSYTATVPRGVSACTGGPYQRSTDVWTAFDVNGTAYFFSLGFDNNPSPNVNGPSGMLVTRSTDGGLTWDPQISLIADTDPLFFNDKNSLTADPTRAGYAYAVWDRLAGPPLAFRAPGGSDEQNAVAATDGLERARNRIASSRAAAATGAASPVSDTFGPTYYSRTTDGGLTWERSSPIYDPGKGAQTIGNVVAVTPDGTVFDFFTNIDTVGNISIASIRSKDHGFSWSTKPVTAVQPAYYSGFGAVTPDSRQLIRQSDIIFSVSADQASGAIDLVWQTTPPAPSPSVLVGVYFAQSTDGGNTWSTPVKINKTPKSASVVLRGEAFNETIVAGPNNTLVATYYDFRNDTGANGQELADVWALFCTPVQVNDCTKAKNWGRELRLTDTSFDILTAPVSTGRGYFLGDYFGLVAQGASVYAAFTATNGTPGQTNLYTRAINLGTTTASR